MQPQPLSFLLTKNLKIKLVVGPYSTLPRYQLKLYGEPWLNYEFDFNNQFSTSHTRPFAPESSLLYTTPSFYGKSTSFSFLKLEILLRLKHTRSSLTKPLWESPEKSQSLELIYSMYTSTRNANFQKFIIKEMKIIQMEVLNFQSRTRCCYLKEVH